MKILRSWFRSLADGFSRQLAGRFAVGLGLVLGSSARAHAASAHSDIIVSHSDGGLRVDAQIHTGNVRENDASGNGTVWATDNPGFAGSRFAFDDELLFDVTGPLRRWADGRWSTNHVGPEFMQFIEPGPFGDSLNSVTITRSTTFASGYRIAQIGARGTLHTHFVFLLRATDGVAPAVGAYSFPITLRSPQYGSSPPVHLVFNNGLEGVEFDAAVERFRAAQELRLFLTRGAGGTLVLSLLGVEGRTNHLLSAPTTSGPWTGLGDPFVGTGDRREFLLSPSAEHRFFRAIAP